MNIYCGVLSTITVAQTFRPQWKADATARIVLSLVFIVLALAMAYDVPSFFVADGGIYGRYNATAL